jgi:hypothetical protein
MHALRLKAPRPESAEVRMMDFRREQVEYELRLSRDAYRCAVTVEARISLRREAQRLELLLSKGGA